MAKNYDQKLSLSKVHVQCTLHHFNLMLKFIIAWIAVSGAIGKYEIPLVIQQKIVGHQSNADPQQARMFKYFFKCQNTVTQQKVKSNAHGDPQWCTLAQMLMDWAQLHKKSQDAPLGDPLHCMESFIILWKRDEMMLHCSQLYVKGMMLCST